MISAAIVGLGWWGQTIVRSLQSSTVLKITHGADVTGAGRQAASDLGLVALGSFEEALGADVDAIILCTPHTLHAGQVFAAANAGKHVFSEKPFTDSVERARAALDAVSAAGVTVGVGHERRFEPAVREMRRQLDAGDLGLSLVFEGNFSQEKFLALPPDNWRLSKDFPVGPLSATGIHLVDLAVSLLGRPVDVLARLRTSDTGFANGDTVTLTIGFETGATALITAILTTPFLGRVCLLGSRGWYEIRDREHPESPKGWDVTTRFRGGDASTSFWDPYPAVRDNLELFARAAEGVAVYPISHAEIISTVSVFEAVLESAKTGKIVETRQR